MKQLGLDVNLFFKENLLKKIFQEIQPPQISFQLSNGYFMDLLLYIEDGNQFLITPHFHSVDCFPSVKARGE